jgi:hypothetical protein
LITSATLEEALLIAEPPALPFRSAVVALGVPPAPPIPIMFPELLIVKPLEEKALEIINPAFVVLVE